jgi:DNA polymerase-3 subunit alpha
MGSAQFVHLRAHSAYSLLEGALPIERLIDLACVDGQPALAIADTDNLFGALEFSEKAAAKGLQPIIGCALSVDLNVEAEDAVASEPGAAVGRLVLLASTERGYANLVKLASAAYLSDDRSDEVGVGIARLGQHADGLIALTGGPDGPLDTALTQSNRRLATQWLEALSAIFSDALYIEVQRHGTAAEAGVEQQLIELAYAHEVPLVATNQPYFAAAEDFESHDALICIAAGRTIMEDDRRRLTGQHYFKSRAEMALLFADLPEALANTIEIARRCAFRPTTRAPILPRFVSVGEAAATDSGRAEADLLREQAHAGLEIRLQQTELDFGVSRFNYVSRLEFELDVIEGMRYPGYFLIVADFIKWAKDQGIPVGPGRGSGAGSLVAYSLTITDLDPMRFGLLFERFLNPERVSMPDFDIDFCQDRRDEVIRYVQTKYGQDQVAQIITFGTLQARAVLRDVGRVLQMPYGQVDRLCKMVPSNPANPVTLAQAIDGEPRLQEARGEEEIVARLMDISIKLEGLFRHASTHAAGIVIGDRPLDELVPLYRDPRSDMPVTQFNMKWVESAGLVKFDFLGLKTLTVINKAIQLIARRGVTIDLDTLPLDDAATFDMLSRAETVGVFQLESAGMRKAIADMKPDRFDDIVALVALYRPGPMANIPTYCARKHDLEQPDYLHPKLEPILRETFGVITYQEQVMQIAQVLSGYSLGEADLLRRAMGKKIKSEMDAQRERFVDGAVERGVVPEQANMIFDLLSKFADYGFNKCHAAPYALVAYQTAYLKANHPAEFLAASMTLDVGNTDKLNDFRQEAKRLNISVEPPSVNNSSEVFDVREGRIFYSLAAIKGVGRQVVEHIVEARAGAPFTGIGDFAARIQSRMVNKRVLDNLVAAGAFDELEPNRARMSKGIDLVLSESAFLSDNQNQDAFDFGGNGAIAEIQLHDAKPWLPAEQLQREFQAIGFYFSAHPLDEYADVIKRMEVYLWSEFSALVKQGRDAGRLVGTVTARQERRTRNGNRMGVVQMSDPSGQYEAVVFSETLSQYRDLLEPGQSVVLLVSAEDRQEGVSVRVQRVDPLDTLAGKIQKCMKIFMRAPEPLQHVERQLDRTGDGEVSLILMLDNGAGTREVELRLPGGYRVSPQIASALKAVNGVLQVEVN